MSAENEAVADIAAKLREALTKLDKWLYVGVDGYVHSHPNKAHEIKRTIKSALAAPPHEANWTDSGGYEFACCSNCGHMQYAGWDSRSEQAEKIGEFHKEYKFCPNCGAKMRENYGQE